MSEHDPQHAYWCAVPECPQYVRKHHPADLTPSAEALLRDALWEAISLLDDHFGEEAPGDFWLWHERAMAALAAPQTDPFTRQPACPVCLEPHGPERGHDPTTLRAAAEQGVKDSEPLDVETAPRAAAYERGFWMGRKYQHAHPSELDVERLIRAGNYVTDHQVPNHYADNEDQDLFWRDVAAAYASQQPTAEETSDDTYYRYFMEEMTGKREGEK